ncbi:MAG: CsoS2 family carboxysome shell protein, partial [Prochlorococcaceae cyanobacterium]
MASTSSREAALERRRALTTAGKKAVSRFSSSPGRVRSAADARPSRTEVTETPSPAAAAHHPAPERPRAPQSLSAMAVASSPQPRSTVRRVSNPSRDLALARREAMSRCGKRASTSRDRNRADVVRTPAPAAAPAAPAPPSTSGASSPVGSTPRRTLSLGTPGSVSNGNLDQRSQQRRVPARHNPSRSLVMARREALSKRGKSATMPGNGAAAAVARQNHPDLSTRELAQKLRELKSKVGSAGCARSGGTRPCGPNRHGAREAAAADAHWKVGVSETSGGQVVTGTQANRSPKTTGNEAATCRPITGTEYLGAEVFQSFCQRDAPVRQPEKVHVTATSHGNRVTGNEVGRSEKVTGDEPGTCKTITGTEYISANQSAAYCGTVNTTPRKVGRSATLGGQAVSGVMVGRSERVTGDEPGSGLQLTGDQYLGAEPQVPGQAPSKVERLQTLRGTGITGTAVGRSERVTGNEPGSCRNITGDEYIGSQQYEGFCGTKPAPEAPKVGFSVTNKAQVVSGTRTGRSNKVTGDEPGTCKVVTGTPYAGLEQASDYCSTNAVRRIRERTPVRGVSRMSGIQPGIGGVMTGAARGACEEVSG